MQAANRFVFRTGVRALEGLEEDGAGELLDGRSEEVKNQVMNLFLPLLPPPPRIVDVIHPAPLLPNAQIPGNWWTPAPQSLAPHPVDSWRVLPSTPSPTATSCSDNASNAFWQDMSFSSIQQLPSPTPSFSQPVFTTAPSHFYSSPQTMAPQPAFHLPSQYSQHCGTDMGMGHFNDFGWSSSNFTSHYATAV